MVECELHRIVLRDTSEEQFIYLKEKGGDGRLLPIVIGRPEARAIDRRVRNQPSPRPMSHDLMSTLVEALGARLDRVTVTGLKDGTFYASLRLVRDGETVEVDSRPSDAVALAVRLDAPIFVAEEVLREAAVSPG